MRKIKMLLLFGGRSAEHEVSLRSVVTVINNADKTKYEIIPVYIDKNGSWYCCAEQDVLSGSYIGSTLEKVFLTCDPSVGGIVSENGTVYKIDVAYIGALHGRNCEDGRLQGALHMSGIPFVGCDVLSSALCMDKCAAKIMLSAAGIDVAKYVLITGEEFLSDKNAVLQQCENISDYPLFVKPCNSGSSIGMSRVENRIELSHAIDVALKYDNRVLVEESVSGHEIEVAVLGSGNDLAVSRCGEVLPGESWYTYDDKYADNSKSRTVIPAGIESELSEKIRCIAAKAYNALLCEGLSRVDFLIKDERIVLNEINTLPGFTSISMFSQLMEDLGIGIPEIIDRLISLSMKRGKEECL